MATTPSIFNFTDDWKWVTQHVILLILAGLLVFGAVYGVESLLTKHDIAMEAKYSQILNQQSAQTQLLETQLKTDESNWTQLSSQLTSQNAADQQIIATRDSQINQLITKINVMKPPQIAADLQTKLHSGVATVLPDGIKLDTNAARDVDSQLAQGTAAEQNLVITKTELENEVMLVNGAEKTISVSNTALAAEQKKNADQITACSAEVRTVKAEATKGKLKWFGIGVVVGFIGRAMSHP